MTTFLVIILLLYLFLRFALPYLIPYLLKLAVKQQAKTYYRQESAEHIRKKNGEMSVDYIPRKKNVMPNQPVRGEYVDYEELRNH